MATEQTIVVSGAPGTGKSTVALHVADDLSFPLLSLDDIKETLGDCLGTGNEEWSDRTGDAAAEIIFRLNRTSSCRSRRVVARRTPGPGL
jgi:predicted kinase